MWSLLCCWTLKPLVLDLLFLCPSSVFEVDLVNSQILYVSHLKHFVLFFALNKERISKLTLKCQNFLLLLGPKVENYITATGYKSTPSKDCFFFTSRSLQQAQIQRVVRATITHYCPQQNHTLKSSYIKHLKVFNPVFFPIAHPKSIYNVGQILK